MFIDVLAVIPFEVIYGWFTSAESQTNSSALKIFGLMKLIRLLRLGRILRYMKFKSNYKILMKIG